MRSRSAAIELTLLVVLVMALLLSSLTWLTMHWQSAWMLNEVQRGLSLASDTLQSSLRDSMMHNRRDQIVDAIERVSRDTGIRKIRILNHRGQVMLSTAPDGLRDRLGVTAPECNICHEDARDPTVVRSLAVGTRTILEGSTLRAFTPILAEQGCVTAACHRQDAKSGPASSTSCDISRSFMLSSRVDLYCSRNTGSCGISRKEFTWYSAGRSGFLKEIRRMLTSAVCSLSTMLSPM